MSRLHLAAAKGNVDTGPAGTKLIDKVPPHKPICTKHRGGDPRVGRPSPKPISSPKRRYARVNDLGRIVRSHFPSICAIFRVFTQLKCSTRDQNQIPHSYIALDRSRICLIPSKTSENDFSPPTPAREYAWFLHSQYLHIITWLIYFLVK